MKRVVIAQKGWSGFTGNMGSTYFENGYAELSDSEIRRIAANIKLQEVDEYGNELGFVGPTVDMVRTSKLSAPVVKSRRTYKNKTEETSGSQISQKKEIKDDIKEVSEFYTRDDLEGVADLDGIKGLRKIAESYGIKGTSISNLIEEILIAQDED